MASISQLMSRMPNKAKKITVHMPSERALTPRAMADTVRTCTDKDDLTVHRDAHTYRCHGNSMQVSQATSCDVPMPMDHTVSRHGHL